MSKKQKGLGRGLDSLLGPSLAEPSVHATQSGATAAAGLTRSIPASGPAPEPGFAGADAAPPSEGLMQLPEDQLQAGRYQPRTRMDDGSLRELAQSITEHGVLQPIVVRAIGQNRFEVIAGERRLRAARMAGLKTVPVLLRSVADSDALAMALIENIQREDLNPLEEAMAIRRLIDEFQYTHDRAAQSIGRSRSATSNLLRLLNLADHVQRMLMDGRIEMGHARCLLPLDRVDQVQVAAQIEQKRLSVREAEKLAQLTLAQAEADAHVQAATAATHAPASARTGTLSHPDVARLQERIAERLGTRVELKAGAGGKGRLVIHFGDNDTFSGLLERMDLTLALDQQSA